MGDGVGYFVNGRDLCHPHPFLGLRLFQHRLFSAATASAQAAAATPATTATSGQTSRPPRRNRRRR